jgi:hypothetical protein
MLTPDVSKQDLENLYKEAWDLFSVYFNQESPDRIHFSQQVVTEMHAGTTFLLLSQTQCQDLILQCSSAGVLQYSEFR